MDATCIELTDEGVEYLEKLQVSSVMGNAGRWWNVVQRMKYVVVTPSLERLRKKGALQ